MWAFGKERPLQTLLSSFSGTSLLRGGLVYVSSPWAVSDKLGIGGDGQHRQQWDRSFTEYLITVGIIVTFNNGIKFMLKNDSLLEMKLKCL